MRAPVRLALLAALASLIPSCRSRDERRAAEAAAADPVGSCARVLARVAACKDDAGLRRALFRNAAADDRAAAERRFDAAATTWRDAGAARAQCETWATAEPAGTTFARRDALNRLAREVELDCEGFGRELDDEGGPPAA